MGPGLPDGLIAGEVLYMPTFFSCNVWFKNGRRDVGGKSEKAAILSDPLHVLLHLKPGLTKEKGNI